MDLLDRISKKARGFKSFIEADRVEAEEMHVAVHNSVTQLIQLIRKEMSDQDFQSAIAMQVNSGQAPYQSRDIDTVKRNLTTMAKTLRTLQQELLGPEANIYTSIRQTKVHLSTLLGKQSKTHSE